MAIRQVMAKEPLFFNMPVKYRGIQMRSDLEARHAAMMDVRGWTWKYEPKRFYSHTGESYLPDFWVLMPHARECFLELKGAPPDLAAVQKRMEIIWETRPAAFLSIIVARTNTIYGAHGDGDRLWRQS